MEEELQQVVNLILALYSPSTSPQDHSHLQLRLQEVQSSQAAWSIVGLLLQHDDPSVRFFAASTLQLKISRSWSTLPESDHEPLKASLLSWLALSAAQAYPAEGEARAGERVVMRKLASAVTSLSLRLKGWQDWLLEVVVRVSAGDGNRKSAPEAVLEVLGVVIEQVARAELVGGQRVTYMSTLSSSTPYLVSTLSSTLSSPNTPPSEVNSALNCFTSYLLAGQLGHTELTTLYPLLLPHLSNPDTTIAACTAVEELVDRSSGSSSGAGSVQRFIGRMKCNELVSHWATSEWVQGVIRRAVEEEDADDETLAVMKLVCSLSEHFITFVYSDTPTDSHIVNLTLNSPQVAILFQLLLAITAFPGHSMESYNINEMTSGVWMALQEESSDIGLVSGPGGGREGRDGKEAEWVVLGAVFAELAQSLRIRAQWPSREVSSTWTKDALDGFRVYRSTVLYETLLYAYYILRESMLAGIVSLAEQQIARPALGPSDGLEDLEATFFVLSSVQEAVPADESTFLPRLFGPAVIGRLPPSGFLPLRTTALQLIGAYSPWFTSEPEACISAVTFVVAGLSEPQLCPAAAKSLRLLCNSNRKTLIPHVASFVQVLSGLDGNVEDSEVLKVLESVSSVVQALPPSQIVEPLLCLVNPLIEKLGVSVHSYSQNPTESRDLCLQQLGYLTVCAKGMSSPEDDLVDLDSSFDDSPQLRELAVLVANDERIVAMRAQLGSTIEGVVSIWAGDVEVVQALSEYIKCSNNDAIPSPLALDHFLLLTLATSALQASISSVWLSISGTLLTRMARDQTDFRVSEENLAKTGRLVEVGLSIVLNQFSSLASMDENPDVVQAFVAYCISLVKHYPSVFTVLPTHLDAIITFAERGLGMQEHFSLKATIDLLIISVQQTKMAGPSSSIFRQTLIPHTRPILFSLLTSIGGGVPRSHLSSLSELLHACVLRMLEETRAAVRELLATPGWPTSTTTDESKAKFERAVMSARTGKQVRQAVSDFALVCRGLDGSAYGAASMSAFD